MAIALPAPIEPQLAPIAEVRAGARTEVAFGTLQFEIADFCGLGPGRIRAVAAIAGTPSDLVRGIGNACYAAGWPAERTLYAIDGAHLYVAVRRGRIAALGLPPRYLGYFEQLLKRQLLRQSDLEGARALADSLSERAGDNYEMELEPVGGDAAKLVLKGPTAGRAQAQAAAGFATSGNRYSGRYLADAQIRLSAGSGTELSLGGVVGVRPPALRDSLGGPYHEADAGLSQITPLGVFGADGRYVDFAPSTDATFAGQVNSSRIGLVGHIREAGLSWLDALYASYNQRLTVNLRVDRSEETIRYQAQHLLTQRYTKLELSINGITRFTIGGSDNFDLQAGAVLGHGLKARPFPADNNGNLDPAHGQYSLARPSLRLSYGSEALFTPSIEASAQFASATVPQLEQFVLGGPGLRAFEAGTAAGDRGYLGRVAIEQRRIALGALSFKPAVFAEYGAARFRASAPGIPAGTAHRADVGLELNLRLGSHLELTGYVAEPLEHDQPNVISDDKQRLGARLQLNF